MKTKTLITSLLILGIHFIWGQKIDPKIYSSISTQLREKTSVAFIGTFYTGRGPCQTYAVGKRRWRLIKGFKIDDDILGNIKIKEIEISPYLLTDSLETNFNLINGGRYCVLLNPSSEMLEYITNNKTSFNHDKHLILNEEIISITKIE